MAHAEGFADRPAAHPLGLHLEDAPHLSTRKRVIAMLTDALANSGQAGVVEEIFLRHKGAVRPEREDVLVWIELPMETHPAPPNK